MPAQPITVRVTRHQCPHCRRTHSKKTAAVAHIARCWHNPDARACKTCRHFIPECEGPYPEHPNFPEECEAGRDLTEGLVTGCPLWQPATTEPEEGTR